jgi:predicted nucleotidyltransferase
MTTETLSQLLTPHLQRYPVQRAYLFGSVARQEHHAQSDVDILLELSAHAEMSLLDFANLRRSLTECLGRKVDCVTSTAVSRYIWPFIEKDKQLIYAKAAGR